MTSAAPVESGGPPGGLRIRVRRVALLGGPLAAVLVGLALAASGLPGSAAITAGLTLLCAVWWIFEPLPIALTALLPLAVFPLLGVLTPVQVAQAYGSPLILLLMGGFMISAAMARSGAHRRIALQMVRLFGGRSARALVLGFAAAAALLSMWISNTATTLMLLPVALAVLEDADERLAVPLLLAIAYAASIGGMGTPIGTTPNLIFMQVYADRFGQAPDFLDWMGWGLPVVVLFVPLVGLWLTRGLRLARPVEVPHPGAWRPAEVRVLLVFGVTALLWVTRTAPLGGWALWLDLPQANDAAVALLAVVALGLLPDGRGGPLLDWPTARDIPWGVLILFGGGIAIASAFEASGLAGRLASNLAVLAQLPTWLLLLLVCLAVTFLTEVTSNTATASLLMPLLAAAAIAAGLEPRLLMVPAALSASCAFMLPVATAPNAVIYGSERVPLARMAREGFVLNLVGSVLIAGLSLLLLT